MEIFSRQAYPQQPLRDQERYLQIDILRGLAALAVCFFHLTGSSGLSIETARIGKFGYLGVEAFFVISGFIIPYSMYRMNYKLSEFGYFMLKRLARINPPYLVVIFLTLFMMVISQREVLPSFPSILQHFFYVNTFFGNESISPVFWTLIIEFQFYIFIGLFFYLISYKDIRVFIGFVQLILLINLLSPNSNSLPGWFGPFISGILLFRFKYFKLRPSYFSILLVETAVVISYKNGINEAIISLLTVLAIYYAKVNLKSIASQSVLFLGAISYSLYLTHWEFGRAIVAVTRHVPVLGNFENFRVLMGMVGSIVVASLFFFFIEKPSIKLASHIHRKNNA